MKKVKYYLSFVIFFLQGCNDPSFRNRRNHEVAPPKVGVQSGTENPQITPPKKSLYDTLHPNETELRKDFYQAVKSEVDLSNIPIYFTETFYHINESFHSMVEALVKNIEGISDKDTPNKQVIKKLYETFVASQDESQSDFLKNFLKNLIEAIYQSESLEELDGVLKANGLEFIKEFAEDFIKSIFYSHYNEYRYYGTKENIHKKIKNLEDCCTDLENDAIQKKIALLDSPLSIAIEKLYNIDVYGYEIPQECKLGKEIACQLDIFIFKCYFILSQGGKTLESFFDEIISEKPDLLKYYIIGRIIHFYSNYVIQDSKESIQDSKESIKIIVPQVPQQKKHLIFDFLFSFFPDDIIELLAIDNSMIDGYFIETNEKIIDLLKRMDFDENELDQIFSSLNSYKYNPDLIHHADFVKIIQESKFMDLWHDTNQEFFEEFIKQNLSIGERLKGLAKCLSPKQSKFFFMNPRKNFFGELFRHLNLEHYKSLNDHLYVPVFSSVLSWPFEKYDYKISVSPNDLDEKNILEQMFIVEQDFVKQKQRTCRRKKFYCVCDAQIERLKKNIFIPKNPKLSPDIYHFLIGHELAHTIEEITLENRAIKQHFEKFFDEVVAANTEHGSQLWERNEVLADFFGLNISYEIFLSSLDSSLSESEQKEKKQQFFIDIAKSFLEVKDIDVEDVHMPSYLRINIIFSHFSPFYEAFDIRHGDMMFVDKSKRFDLFSKEESFLDFLGIPKKKVKVCRA